MVGWFHFNAENDDPRKDGGIVERLKFCSGNVHLKTSLPLTNIRELTNPKIPDSAGNLKSVVVDLWATPSSSIPSLSPYLVSGAWPDHYFGEPSVSVAIALILASTPSSPQSRTTSTRLRITLVVDARLTSKLSKVLGR
ncbi:hypothetical protein Fcan01_28650 [Folsomia candida]|uniref:Uncharacterized protein n=1 Tax=Folsomia candida TaxID=158441 RepID=A0A226CSX7_FOLCA|nr:hypothetical protein Fcan01_28650 [Folsomia candida]